MIDDREDTARWMAVEQAIDLDLAASRKHGRISSVGSAIVLAAAVVISLLILRGLWPPRSSLHGAPPTAIESVQ